MMTLLCYRNSITHRFLHQSGICDAILLRDIDDKCIKYSCQLKSFVSSFPFFSSYSFFPFHFFPFQKKKFFSFFSVLIFSFSHFFFFLLNNKIYTNKKKYK